MILDRIAYRTTNEYGKGLAERDMILLHALMLPDFERADGIGEFWGYPESRTFAELLDRLQGGPGAPGGARRDAAGDGTWLVVTPALNRAVAELASRAFK